MREEAMCGSSDRLENQWIEWKGLNRDRKFLYSVRVKLTPRSPRPTPPAPQPARPSKAPLS